MLRSLEHEQLLNRAQKAYDNKEYSKSMTLLNEVLESDDRNVKALFLIANIFHIKGEISKAIKHLKKFLMQTLITQMPLLVYRFFIMILVIMKRLRKYSQQQVKE
ncbi:M48 family metallopeptidase [Bacteriovorax sp. DB6_IX]|uniref:tetratricopeptide repeat protein n=1 Tax=Bacteriovorax sp. DB6_IX TaxID=1353530 RepID=UPI000389E047|nr:tetratricopeptide repeat protein [Bacteriovorax sp. DB6_IX]EQC52082.1 tetratricopeptide repeat protein [Bacteriovorax sp. DB6_IX]